MTDLVAGMQRNGQPDDVRGLPSVAALRARSARTDAAARTGRRPSPRNRQLPSGGSASSDPAAGVRPNIVWLASYPKSGNTWVRVFLHNLMREMRGETEGEQDINDLGRFTIWEHSLRHFRRVLGKSPHEATMEEIARARPQVQRLISAQQPKLALAKTHLCFGTDHGYPTIDLSVTRAVVYIVRNPLDVAISYAHHCGRSIDATIADMATPGMHIPATASNVSETIGSWSQHVTSWLGIKDRPVYVIRYEDMLAQPSELFGTLAKYLGLRPTPLQLETAVRKSSFETLVRQEKSRGFVEKPKLATRFFRDGTSGQWRTVLDDNQIKAIERAHKLTMRQLNYA